MKIGISLPRPCEVNSTEEVRSFLKQLEISVHHAQKSLEELVRMEKESGKDTEFTVMYRLYGVEDSGSGETFESENAYTDDIELEIYPA